MPALRLFRRSPRQWPDLPDKEHTIELPSAPMLPPPEAMRLPQLLQVVVPGAISLVAVVAQLSSPGLGNSLSWLLTGMMGIYPIFTLFEFRQRKRDAEKQRKRALDTFRDQLEQRERELSNIATRQHQALSELHPELEECVTIARRLDSRLWCRDPHDIDFLTVRLGDGKVPILAQIKRNPSGQTPALDQDADDLARRFALVRSPVTAPLAQWMSTGVVARGEDRYSLLRALVVSLATHHSPDEVKIAALFPASESRQWEWIAHLPHARIEGFNQKLIVSDPNEAESLLRSLRDQIEQQGDELKSRQADALGTRVPPVRYVILMADPALYEKNKNTIYLFTDGLVGGATPIVFAHSPTAVPRQCKGVIELANDAGTVRPMALTAQSPQLDFSPDDFSLDQARAIARELSTVELQRTVRPDPVPERIRFMEMLNVSSVEALDVSAKWARHIHETHALPAPIGMMAGRELMQFNIRDGDGPDVHGAHVLVAGTTGFGKSRLLQTLVLSLAVHYHPHQVSFFLIDFKGGATANMFKGLPHVRGNVTDLDKGAPGTASSLLHRTVTALRSELEYREHRFGEANVDYIDDYQKVQAADSELPPIPRLIIIVDEFAELKQQHPDFLDELVKTARTGRSLGVHLILATQQPAGIVDDQVLTNIRSVLCLKMRSPSDSTQLLDGRPDAAFIKRRGYGYILVGSGERFDAFQTALCDDPYPGDVGPNPRSELTTIVQHLSDTAQAMQLAPLPPLSKPPLPDPRDATFAHAPWARTCAAWALGEWRADAPWMAPTVGLVDDPYGRRQEPLAIDLDAWGHLVAYGRAGSGKTTLVQTLLTQLMRQHAPADLHVYALDFNSQTLKAFENMPHVGNVILEGETERVERLLGYLTYEINRRKRLVSEAGMGTRFAQYRAAAARSDGSLQQLPALLIVLDGFTVFATAFEDSVDVFNAIVADGAAVGVHVVLTANSPTNVPMRLINNFRLAMTFELSDDDYYTAVGPTQGLKPASVLGRGLIKRASPLLPLEFQVQPTSLILDDAQRLAHLRALGDAMTTAWAGQPGPRPIRVLDAKLTLDAVFGNELDVTKAVLTRDVPLGLQVDDLSTFALDLAAGPHFLVIGEPLTGKTTTLLSLAMSITQFFPDASLYLCDMGQNDEGLATLSNLPNVTGGVADAVECMEAQLAELTDVVAKRRKAFEAARRKAGNNFDGTSFVREQPIVALLIDDYGAFAKKTEGNEEVTEALANLINNSRSLGVHVVMAGNEGDFFNASAPAYVDALARTRAGIVLGATESDVLPFHRRESTPDVSEGFYVRRSKAVRIKVGMPTRTTLVKTLAAA
jgi:S-DNA-T family DNA segregation ATPase FtsK/SpoIIIE